MYFTFQIVDGNVIVILFMVVFLILSLMSLTFLLIQPQQSSIAVCDMPIQMIQVNYSRDQQSSICKQCIVTYSLLILEFLIRDFASVSKRVRFRFGTN